MVKMLSEKKFRAQLKKKGWSMSELKRRSILNGEEVHLQNFYHWFSGKKSPTLESLRPICELLESKVQDLID